MLAPMRLRPCAREVAVALLSDVAATPIDPVAEIVSSPLPPVIPHDVASEVAEPSAPARWRPTPMGTGLMLVASLSPFASALELTIIAPARIVSPPLPPSIPVERAFASAAASACAEEAAAPMTATETDRLLLPAVAVDVEATVSEFSSASPASPVSTSSSPPPPAMPVAVAVAR